MVGSVVPTNERRVCSWAGNENQTRYTVFVHHHHHNIRVMCFAVLCWLRKGYSTNPRQTPLFDSTGGFFNRFFRERCDEGLDGCAGGRSEVTVDVVQDGALVVVVVVCGGLVDELCDDDGDDNDDDDDDCKGPGLELVSIDR